MTTVRLRPRDALAYAAKHVGVRGPAIDAWCELAGLRPPQPWSGGFADACLVAGGIASGAPWIASPAAIERHARSGAGGWSWHVADGQPGDLALFGDPIAVHVELVRAQLSATRYSTYGGDTSPGGDAGGGTVARHDDRSTLGGFAIVGFARPPWKP